MRKTLSIFLALILTFACFTLSGCSGKNNDADNSDTKSDTYIEDDNTTDNSETEAENTENTISNNNKVEKDADGLYVYKLCNDAVEIHINTNVWDYIDGDNVWDATRMAADLGFTEPVLFKNHSLNGFQTSDKYFKVLIWDATDDIPNEFGLIMTNDLTLTAGDNLDSPSEVAKILNTSRLKVGTNGSIHEKGFYQIAGSFRQETKPVGTTFDIIVLTAAAMEVCNESIDYETINNALAIFKYPVKDSYYLIP